jgi:low temperature requirement protein LtrA
VVLAKYHGSARTSWSSAFLLGADGLLGALARARVRLRALAANRQAATVAQAAIAADVGQPLDVARDLTPQVAFDLDLAVDRFAQLLLVVFGEVLDARVRIDARALQDLLRVGSRCRRCR